MPIAVRQAVQGGAASPAYEPELRPLARGHLLPHMQQASVTSGKRQRPILPLPACLAAARSSALDHGVPWSIRFYRHCR